MLAALALTSSATRRSRPLPNRVAPRGRPTAVPGTRATSPCLGPERRTSRVRLGDDHERQPAPGDVHLVSDGSGSMTSSVIVRRDATPPSVRASAERGPDNNGWYNRGVSISFTGDDGTSGIASCSSATYSGPDTGGTASAAAASTTRGIEEGRPRVKYDGTPPSVEAKPDRPPDGNGWYRRAVTVTFVGSDAVVRGGRLRGSGALPGA